MFSVDCQLFLQCNEVLVGFQVRVGLSQGEEGSQGLGQCVFDLCPLFYASLKRCRLLARPDDLIECLPFVGGIALDGLDQVGNQVMTPLELHINGAPAVFDLISGADETIVKDHDKNAQNDEADNNDHH